MAANLALAVLLCAGASYARRRSLRDRIHGQVLDLIRNARRSARHVI